MNREKLLIVIIVLLLGNSLYIWNQVNNSIHPIFRVNIAIADDNSFESKKLIKNQDDVNNILMGIMNLETIAKPDIVDENADAMIIIDSHKGSDQYPFFYAWIENNDVIFSTGIFEETEYKKTQNGWGPYFIELIETVK